MTQASQPKTIILFTDGSCLNNGKSNARGGMGVHFPNKELTDLSQPYSPHLIKGFTDSNACTNQKTELYAILLALRYINNKLKLRSFDKITIITDSQFSIDCFTKWAQGWCKNDWQSSKNQDVKNKQVIQLIYKYVLEYNNIEFKHVRSHTGKTDFESVGNDKADQLANLAAV